MDSPNGIRAIGLGCPRLPSASPIRKPDGVNLRPQRKRSDGRALKSPVPSRDKTTSQRAQPLRRLSYQ